MSVSEAFSPYICARDLIGHRDSINAIAFAPDGRYLASGGDDSLLFVFNPHTGSVVHKLVTGSPVTALHWDASGVDQLFVGLGSTLR